MHSTLGPPYDSRTIRNRDYFSTFTSSTVTELAGKQ